MGQRMTSTARGRIAVGVATELLILLPLAGAASGVYWAFQLLSAESRVGEWAAVLAAVVVFSVGGLLGFAAGVGVGWVIARGLFRWANGCGLGDIRDDGLEV
jgi:hypothetical protein